MARKQQIESDAWVQCMVMAGGIFHSRLLHQINNEMYAFFSPYMWVTICKVAM